MQKKKAPSTVSVHAIMLMGYDLVMLAIVSILLLVFYPSSYYPITRVEALMHYLLAAACMLGCRAIGDSYNNVWRYGGNNLYVNLICYDALAGAVYYVIQKVLPLRDVEFLRAVTLFALNLLGDILMRQIYQYLYDANSRGSRAADFLRVVTQKLTGIQVEPEDKAKRDRRINIAIIGAGRVGAGLAADLASNPDAAYTARFFVDIDRNKIGRSINGVPVFSEEEANSEAFRDYNIQEIVFAIPGATAERKKELYTYYKQTGCKLKTYDYPTTQSVNGKRSLRDFDAEELLFRQATEILSEDTKAYYRGKTVLISGGGGSIGSELCRQIAKIGPKRLVVLDVYENGAYDVQQELKIKHGKDLDLCVEIVTITDKGQLERVFRTHRPDVVIHAAAHKHVPLMEDNCCEAVKNNVFGTRNLLDVAESCGCQKFIMVSTDKAVNPTNVMGATKRMCEMEVLNHRGSMSCSATRFGNVLGSNGSVIPLFKRQIMYGGPVTLTDRRIIRYFMTIPEAAQLVLTSGAMAKHGELFVLDMGKPVHILELAENMIRLSGYEPYKDIDIVETGLRPGEKLYEELLVKTEDLTKTDNDQIFVERDRKLAPEEIDRKLAILSRAVATEDDALCRQALKETVETFREPEEVNQNAEEAKEMQEVQA
mgnify:FL=1